MENNELKEKIRKNIKEDIAISNIRKEFDMKTSKNKKIVYSISSICAVFILGISIFLGVNNSLFKENGLEIGKTEDFNKNKEESLNIELNINKIKDMLMTQLDADTKTIDVEELPEKFNFMEDVIIPEKYKLESSYNVYVKESKDIEEYNILHDYVFIYKKDDLNDIKIAFSEIENPLRDYYIEEGEKISKIGDVEVIISQWKQMYIVSFEYENIYFDIETTGITENQLITLLESIIDSTSNSKNEIIEEKDTNTNESPIEIDTMNYPKYYSGKYIDNNGNNVVLLSEDNTENRKQICSILGITESKTIFKKAEYTYEYLTDLQNKISKKMQNNELPFVTSSALMEDSNNIKVTVTSNNINDLNKIKELDTIGGAIEIQYVQNGIGTEDLLVNLEEKLNE